VAAAPTQTTSGRIVIRTPRASFRRDNADASRTAHFSAQVASGCEATVLVAGRGVATRRTARAQIAGLLAGSGRVLAHSGAAGRATALVEYDVFSDETGEPTGARRLYGLAVVRVAPRRFVDVRMFVNFGGAGCTDAARGSATFTTALVHVLASARPDVRFVAR
jgi:hypothetical protein